MAWFDRMGKEAAYTSPGGTRTVFEFEDLQRFVDRKTAAFESPDASATFVQDNGTTSDRFPMRIFFSGPDYDQQADAFFETLRETGVGRLEHPRYGQRDVIPLGRIEQVDAVKNAGGQATFTLEFWETAVDVFPLAELTEDAEVTNAVAAFNATGAEEFAQAGVLNSQTAQASFKNQYTAALSATSRGLSGIAATSPTVSAQFSAIVDSIDNGVDALVSEPLTLAFQTYLAAQAPARAAGLLRDKIEAYGNLARTLIGVSEPDGDEVIFRARDNYATGYVSGSIVATLNSEIETRPQALEAAANLETQLAEVTAWREANFAAIGRAEAGGTYQKLQEATVAAVRFLVRRSFSLRQERVVVLNRARSLPDLLAELFQKPVDNELDFFITSNNLSGSEVLELPKGRSLVYYV